MASFDNESDNLSKFFKEDFEFFLEFSGIDLNLKESYVAIEVGDKQFVRLGLPFGRRWSLIAAGAGTRSGAFRAHGNNNNKLWEGG